MKKFAFVMNIPSPYRLHLLTEMWRQLSVRGIEMQVHFMARGHSDRPKSWLNPKIDFPHMYWPDYGFGEFHLNPGMVFKLLRHQPDYLFCTSPYDTFTGVALMLGCKKTVRIAWQETNTKTPGKLDGFVGWFKRKVLTACQFIGVPGHDAIKQLAMQQERTSRTIPPPVILPNLIDESKFQGVAAVSATERRGRKEKVCLIPARFDPVKGLKEFFGVVTPEMVKGWKLVIMGHGPEEEETMAIVRKRGLLPFVEVIHSVPYAEMPAHYAKADLMLLPSLQDMNPLCVVEALHSGKPLALSCMAGNVEEAVTDGENGWVLPVKDHAAFAAKLKEVFSTSKERLAEMGKISKNVNAKFWDTKVAVKRFLDDVLGQ